MWTQKLSLQLYILVYYKNVYICKLFSIYFQGDVTLSKNGTAGVYGMIATIPDKSIVDDFLVEFFCQVYS